MLKAFKPILLICLVAGNYIALAQETEYPYYNDIQHFKEIDRVSPPQRNAILFIGSSSFTMWQDVQDYFPGYTIINRGFGGSTLLDQIHYANDVIFPYAPKQIVIYCGENDVAYSDTVTAAIVTQRFIDLFKLIRLKLPGVPIVYVSMKPSPSRWQLSSIMTNGNQGIRTFLESQQNAEFVSIWDSMLAADGRPDPSLFLDDNLHMNANGYKIWQKAIYPELIK